MNQSHNNSQHVLAIIHCNTNQRRHEEDTSSNNLQHEVVLESFAKTSELPCDIWRDETNSILLASNYPDCILESRRYCVLCAGFAYRYDEAFHGSKSNNDAAKESFARTILSFCERYEETNQHSLEALKDCIGQCLKACSGHFSVYIVRKGNVGNDKDEDPPQFWAWNDPFGFMPVYHSHNENCCILSSYWDCLTPTLSSMQLDWDIVAEYIVLGTTLGGGGDDGIAFDRTFVEGIRNLGPGYSCYIRLLPFVLEINRYIKCYGACEEMFHRKDLEELDKSSLKSEDLPCDGNSHTLSIRGVKVADKGKELTSSLWTSNTSSVDGDMCKLLFHFILDSVQEAQQYVTRAALTGGGDTRLLLACLLLLQQQNPEMESRTRNNFLDPIVFQTHSKQRTDWYIARYLARTNQLRHRRIHPLSTTTNRRHILRDRNETLLSNLHDQTPLRRKQNPIMHIFQRDKQCTAQVEYTLHGRFGTEFLGCLCFYKSPLDIRSMKELEEFRPKASAWFEAVFGSSLSSRRGDIRNPMDTLYDRMQQLERDRIAFDDAQRNDESIVQTNNDVATFDVSYALQLQLYTRSTLSDIYKGLRGGSWFSIPAAQFTRNAITPFLDNRLLQWMLCRVSTRQKEEPYELYGQLYRSGVVLEGLLGVPSNNKLLCRASGIPHAIKNPEATALPHFPSFVRKGNDKRFQSNSRINAQKALEEVFHPIFWKGAISIITKAPVIMDPKSIVEDSRPEVQALLDHLDGDAEVVCRLSGRLQSFLLWYERRFIVMTSW